MPAPLNNQFWKCRSKHGRDKIFASSEALWAVACEYFHWCDTHPWYKHEPLKGGQRAGEIISVPVARPYTIEGLCVFMGISRDTFYNAGKAAKEEDSSEDFSDIIARIREVIYTQKFEGAAVGIFNASIIARDLGLTEKSRQEMSGPNGMPLHEPSEHRIIFMDYTNGQDPSDAWD